MQESIRKIVNSFQEYCRNGSMWKLSAVESITVNISRYQPVRGGSYIPTPKKIHTKKAVVNVKNNDNKCFVWSVLAALHPVDKHSYRVSQYKQYEKELHVDNMTFPVITSDLKKFEKANNIPIMLYQYDNSKELVEPIYSTSFSERVKDPINLLVLNRGDKYHYVWIKNLNRLLSFDRSNSRVFCPYCLHGFEKKRNGEKNLEKHKPYCKPYGPQRIILPEEGEDIVRFTDFAKQQRIPFVIYADFETLNCKIQGCENSPTTSSTQMKTEHVPCGFSYQIISEYMRFPVKTYRGENTAEEFLRQLVVVEKELLSIVKYTVPMKLNQMEEEVFKQSTHCHICRGVVEPFEKVRDHDHISGIFRGAAHSTCNLNYRIISRIPVIFHNLKGYDAHIICQAMGNVKTKEPQVVAKNLEEYVFFKIGDLHFIDSLQFLSSSLEALTKNLLDVGVNNFKHLRIYFNDKWAHLEDQTAFNLLLRKLVYPYNYMDSWGRFQEEELPSKSLFFNDLCESEICEKDYEHAVKVWKTFKLQNLGQLHDLYVQVDTILLADIFENFRNTSIEHYDLDPAHFHTAPGLTWSAAMKKTGVELELIKDPNMILFIDGGMRGGVSQISNRYAKANNPYIENYDNTKETSYIINLDATNLYGWAMSQYLPTHGFRWCSMEEIHTLQVETLRDDVEFGYILEVDLEYPKELHNLHDDYPCAPEKRIIKADMLSEYQKKLIATLGCNAAESEKLLLTLENKTNYIVHYRNLKMYLSLGKKNNFYFINIIQSL